MTVKGQIDKWIYLKRPYYLASICEEGEIIKTAPVSTLEGEIVKIGKLGKFHFPKHNDEAFEKKKWFLRKGRKRLVYFDILSSEPQTFIDVNGDEVTAYEPMAFRKETLKPELLEVITEEKTTDDINSSSNKYDEFTRLIVYGGIIALFMMIIWFTLGGA